MNFSKIKAGDALSYIMRGKNDEGEEVIMEIKATVTSAEKITVDTLFEENKKLKEELANIHKAYSIAAFGD